MKIIRARHWQMLGMFFLSSIYSQAQVQDSLDIKIGQMILIGFHGTTVDEKVLEEIRAGKVGSVIFFEKNIAPNNSYLGVKKVTWAYQHAATIPLLIGIDQEGGRVNRLKNKYGFPSSITAAAMAKAGSLDSVRIYAEATAATLAGLGFNINFAPVVDLASNPTNPIIAKFGRAFSANEDSVVLMAKEFIKQHHKYHVLTSLKHFPGHGSSKDDTHLGIADVTNTWNETELKPYQELIDSGYADAVMTSHIVNKNLDKEGNPGTLSKDILDGILRTKLKFDGVVFSDDMQMHAITKNYGLEETIRLAINAGVDIMTFSNNISGTEERTVDKVHQIIKNFVKSGAITPERIDKSYKRVMKLKRHLTETPEVFHLEEIDQLKKHEAQLTSENEALKKQLAELQSSGKKSKRKKKK